MIGKIEQLTEKLSFPINPIFGGLRLDPLKKQIMDLQKRVEKLEEVMRELTDSYYTAMWDESGFSYILREHGHLKED